MQKKEDVPVHPRPDPMIAGEASCTHLRAVFCGCVDFVETPLLLGGDAARPVIMFYIAGMVRNERVNDYILKPLSQNEALRTLPLGKAMEQMQKGALYTMSVQAKYTMDELVRAVIDGAVLLHFGGERGMLCCMVPTEEKRGLSPSENEPSIKGARDSFVESIRTNTSLLRRRLRTHQLRIAEEIVGRQTRTPVDVIYIEGLSDPDVVAQVLARLRDIDIDAMLDAAVLEEYLEDSVATPLPQLAYTERPERFCQGICEGRVGVLVDGLPLGYLLPSTLAHFVRANDDRSKNWIEVSFLRILRYACMLIALLLPALYLAAVQFHPEMLPSSLFFSIAEAKLDVPFSSMFELLILLFAFEIVQEAGLRLPPAIGTTVSILGGLVVGSAAVEAKIVSPAVLIVVAIAGIAGFTAPNQEIGASLRLGRIGLLLAAAVCGLYGLMAGVVLVIGHLARLESFGVPYLSPFAATRETAGEATQSILRLPFAMNKLRERALKTRNRRNQK